MRINKSCIYMVALFILLTNQASAQRDPVKDNRAIQYTLKLPFDVQDGTLAVCFQRSVGMPIQASLLLCYVPAGETPEKTVFGPGPVTTYTIKSITELAGKVKINDASSALAYLRIFSTPSTNYLAETPAGYIAAEIIALDDITLDMAFGNKKWLDEWKRYGPGFDGLISASGAKKHKIEKASVRTFQGDYIITRNMIVKRTIKSDILPYRVVERITPNGKYSLVSITELKHLRSLPWLFPAWM